MLFCNLSTSWMRFCCQCRAATCFVWGTCKIIISSSDLISASNLAQIIWFNFVQNWFSVELCFYLFKCENRKWLSAFSFRIVHLRDTIYDRIYHNLTQQSLRIYFLWSVARYEIRSIWKNSTESKHTWKPTEPYVIAVRKLFIIHHKHTIQCRTVSVRYSFCSLFDFGECVIMLNM